ncbi:MAG TPA: hypothetical protein VLL76_01385, partial [Candidatus Omnitrophota bacterium]|nr:hypothetical protein [Candidatus Omnitrophota bacterium]
MKKLTGRFPRSTRAMVFALLAAMIAIVWAEVIKDTVDHYAEYREAQRVVAANATVDHLMHAGQNLGFERGRTNFALHQDLPTSSENRPLIDQRRRAFDTEFAAALEHLGDDALAASFRDKLATLAELRQRADLALALPLAERPAELPGIWFPTLTTLMADVEALMADVSLGPERYTATFRILSRIKIMAFRLRMSLGAESARISSGIAAGRPFDQSTLNEMARLRGESTATWAALKKEIKLVSSDRLQQSLSGVDKLFFADFRPMQDH